MEGVGRGRDWMGESRAHMLGENHMTCHEFVSVLRMYWVRMRLVSRCAVCCSCKGEARPLCVSGCHLLKAR